MEKTKGLIAAPFTAFDEQGALNLGMVARQAAMYKKNGLAGVFICGTTGESASLTLQEKKALFQEWGRHRSPGFKVIAFLGGTCVDECIELAQWAQAQALDGVAVTAPYYFKPASVKALADFCIGIASATPQMPFYYYHIPSFTGVYFPMFDFIQEMDGKLPNFTGIKYTFENLMDFQLCLNYKDNKYDMLWGRDEMLLPALSIGAQGAVGSTYGYMVPLYNKIIELCGECRLAEARHYQLIANKFILLLSKYGDGTGKVFMKNIGLDMGKYRMPSGNLSVEAERLLEEELRGFAFEKYCNVL